MIEVIIRQVADNLLALAPRGGDLKRTELLREIEAAIPEDNETLVAILAKYPALLDSTVDVTMDQPSRVVREFALDGPIGASAELCALVRRGLARHVSDAVRLLLRQQNVSIDRNSWW